MLVEDKGFMEKYGLTPEEPINPNKPLEQQARGTSSSSMEEDEETAA
jgi:hypothetical protein